MSPLIMKISLGLEDENLKHHMTYLEALKKNGGLSELEEYTLREVCSRMTKITKKRQAEDGKE